jgi:hypothetical protein
MAKVSCMAIPVAALHMLRVTPGTYEAAMVLRDV